MNGKAMLDVLEAEIPESLLARRAFRAALEGAELPPDLEVVGSPGTMPAGGVRPDDVLVRVYPGEPVASLVAEITSEPTWSRGGAGEDAEAAGPGYYARIRTISGPAGMIPQRSRQILDVRRRLPAHQVLLRRRPPMRPATFAATGGVAPWPARPPVAVSPSSTPAPVYVEPEPEEPTLGVEPGGLEEPGLELLGFPEPGLEEPAGEETSWIDEPETSLLDPAPVADERFFDVSEDAASTRVHVVLDRDARLRSEPPELRATTARIAYWTRVRLTEARGDYVRVTGIDGTAHGWTKASNVGTFFKDLPLLSVAALAPAEPAASHAGHGALGRGLTDAYNRLGGLMALVARETGIPPAAALAVWYVESAGRRHSVGRAIIRFENHLFFDRWGAAQPATYDRHFQHGGRAGVPGERWRNQQWREDPAQPFATFHGDQTAEYRVLAFATRLANEDTALQCISIGGSQILVSNHRMIGYDTARAMYDAFQADERAHVLGFFDFCNYRYGHGARRGQLLHDLAALRWEDFARGYNGAGQVSQYAAHLSTAYDEAARIAPAPETSPVVAVR